MKRCDVMISRIKGVLSRILEKTCYSPVPTQSFLLYSYILYICLGIDFFDFLLISMISKVLIKLKPYIKVDVDKIKVTQS